MPRLFWLVLTVFHLCVSRSNALPTVPETTSSPSPSSHQRLLARAITTEFSTCGYVNGDAGEPRTAEPGHKCMLNTKNKLFAFCDVNADLEHCTMAGRCIDQHDCKKGCGKTSQKELLAVSCEKKEYCSFAVLTIQKDHTYTYINCGAKAATDHYQITPDGATISGTTTATMVLTRTARITTRATAETINDGSEAIESSTESSTPTETTSEVTSEALDGESSGESSSSPPTNTGAIVGGVIGGLVVVCSTALGAIYLVRRNRSQGAETATTTEQGTPPPPSQEPVQPWVHQEPKQLAGWGPQEMQGSAQFGRDNAAELPG